MRSARLSARPAAPSQDALAPGTHPLGLANRRDALLVVPPRAAPGAPLVLGLHGAGGTGRQMSALLTAEAARRGMLVLAPDSRGTTWDVIRGGYGPDVAFLDEDHDVVHHPGEVAGDAVERLADGVLELLAGHRDHAAILPRTGGFNRCGRCGA